MKLATLKSSNPDGKLMVVSSDNQWGLSAEKIVPSLREAVENWKTVKPELEKLYNTLNSSTKDAISLARVADPPSAKDAVPPSAKVAVPAVPPPLPRSFAWIDGSAYIQHIKLVRKARGAEPPSTLETIPLIYQGGSDTFLGPYDDIPQVDFSHGTDFEAEVGVIVDEVEQGIQPEEALERIILFVLINDISLRGLIPEELKRGFGFFQGKPSSSFAPFAITKEELGSAWQNGRVHLPMQVEFNGKPFGKADAGEMHFHFGELIAHSAKTRSLTAGTIIGSGTVSNKDTSKGCSCIAEKRMLEKINTGKITTNFMKPGDKVKIEMKDKTGKSLFGSIEQKVVQWNP